MPDMGMQWAATRLADAGTDATNSRQTVVTAGNSNVKGAWTQITAATACDYFGLHLLLGHLTLASRFTIDFGIGAAGAEVVILPDYYVGEQSASQYKDLFLPIWIPAGSRLAVRSQNSLTTGTLQHRAFAYGHGPNPRMPVPQGGKALAYGLTVANTQATSIDPGLTVNTKGVWTALTAATGDPISWLLLACGPNNNATTSFTTMTSNTHWLIDIGVGAAGAEVVVLPNWSVTITNNRNTYPALLWVPCSIPAGTRISARAQCSVVTAVERIIDVAIYGIS